MDKINFNENNIIEVFNEGMESVLYYYRVNNDIILLKKFKTKLDFKEYIVDVPKSTLDNKRKKIELINERDYLVDEVKPLNLVYDKDEFIGYTISIDSIKTANEINSKRKKIYILKQLKDKIEKYNECGIYIGDISANNILVQSDGTIKLCDLDNFKIDDLDFDLLSTFQRIYRKKVNNDNNIDNYCFNMFTVAYLQNIYTPYVLYNLRNNGLKYPLNSKENKRIIDSLINLDNNYQKKYLIDNLR